MTATSSTPSKHYSAKEQRNIARLKEYVRIVHNDHGIQAFPRFFSPNFQNPDAKAILGDDGIDAKAKSHVQSSQHLHELLVQAFPDMRTTLLDITADGDKVWAWMKFEGTHTGEWKMPPNGDDNGSRSIIAPTNQPFSFNKMGIMTFEKETGLIVSHSAVTDFPEKIGRLQNAVAAKVVGDDQ